MVLVVEFGGWSGASWPGGDGVGSCFVVVGASYGYPGDPEQGSEFGNCVSAGLPELDELPALRGAQFAWWPCGSRGAVVVSVHTNSKPGHPR